VSSIKGSDRALAGADQPLAPPLVNRALPARGQVYAILRDSIISGELEPNRNVSEQELAGQLGVSRTPVREALIRLADEGLVHVFPQIGTTVAPINIADVYQCQVIREALECRSVTSAVEAITDEQIAELRDVVELQKTFNEQKDFRSFLTADDRLHRSIVQIAGFPQVWKVIEMTKTHLDRVRQLSYPQPDTLALVLEEHEGIINALELRQADLAAERLHDHLDPERMRRMIEHLGVHFPTWLQ